MTPATDVATTATAVGGASIAVVSATGEILDAVAEGLGAGEVWDDTAVLTLAVGFLSWVGRTVLTRRDRKKRERDIAAAALALLDAADETADAETAARLRDRARELLG